MIIPNHLFFSWVEQTLSDGQNARFAVRGTSMLPILRNARDEVELRPCKIEELKKWDIVLFRYKGAHFLHRFVEYKDHTYYMRGDNVFTHRERCQAADIVGVVSKIYRKRSEGKYTELNPHSTAWLLWSRIRWIKPLAGAVLRKLGLR